jgi:hypothetical protein
MAESPLFRPPSREGVTLALQDIGGQVLATIMFTQNNVVRALLDRQPMRVCDALARSRELARAHGFAGYEIDILAELKSMSRDDVIATLAEIPNQVAELSNFVTGDSQTGRLSGPLKPAGRGLSDLGRLQTTVLGLLS